MIARLLIISVLLAGCSTASETTPLDDIELASALRPFDSCASLETTLRDRALDLVQPYGFDNFAMGRAGAEDGTAATAESAGGTAGAADAAAGSNAFSSTNVQEAGVDEPDLAKTDGRSLFTVVDGALRVVDVRGDQPELLATLPLGGGFARDLLLSNDRLLVLGDAGPVDAMDPRQIEPEQGAVGMIAPWLPRTRLWSIDVSAASEPRVVSTMTLDGSTVSARLTDQVARVVIRSDLMPPNMVAPMTGRPSDEQRALATNRESIREATANDWLPTYDVDGGPRQPLVECSHVHEPPAYTDLGTVTVLSIDMDAATLDPGRTRAVLGAADTLYANDERLYVTTSRWPIAIPIDPMPVAPSPDAPVRSSDAIVAPTETQITTQVHQFDLDDADVRYRASGSVPGTVLNQWALSEHDGDLRIATTEGDGFRTQDSQSGVRVLRARDDRLVEIGHVGNLGHGERIFAVRYAGDIGYVVTFRQTDPLYTLDLADPTAPRVLGELKIPGYSAYLHPIGDDLLLGVGQDADAQGQVSGAQVSLFDVSDLSAPDRVAQLSLGRNSYTDVEHDHRAFLYWPDEQMVVLPVQDWNATRVGAAVLTADDSGLDERGFVQQESYGGGGPMPVLRSFVVGDRLITLSPQSVQASDLDTLDPLGLVGFESAQAPLQP